VNKKRFPFGIPTGWFQVGYTSELAVGQVVPLSYFNTELVMFRTSDGTAHVLDAFCPHLGAHLGHGGRVEDDQLICPFHAWQFNGEGKCTAIPYAETIPGRANLTSWAVSELNGLIMVWHDAAGRAPMWEMPRIEEAYSDGWTDIRTKRWTVNTCNQEMAENQVDAAHFLYLHGTAKMPVTKTKRRKHHLVTHSTTAMSTPAGVVEGNIEVNAWGFGFTTTRFTGLVETLLMSSASPITNERSELFFSFMVRDIGKGITGGIGKAFMAEISRQLEQDIPIWEHKTYIDRPLLVKGDGPIGPFRAWAKQFYPPADLLAAQAK
jgi:phenylpropionate dioxygenase-like ring-hydroxylating dioxygenase large terminal subunit